MKGYTDRELEMLWEQFGDLPMNPETECMEAAFQGFPVGTHREEIWHWFDERYSTGVAGLFGLVKDDEPGNGLDNVLWDLLLAHRGHKVSIVTYGDSDDPADVCLECEDCGEVILDAEIYTLCAREDGR